jgi:excisionase family DNA binding protein
MTRPLPTDVERRLLNYERAAAYLGVSVRTMKSLAADGKVVKIPLCGKVLFDRADLDAFIDKTKRSA